MPCITTFCFGTFVILFNTLFSSTKFDKFINIYYIQSKIYNEERRVEKGEGEERRGEETGEEGDKEGEGRGRRGEREGRGGAGRGGEGWGGEGWGGVGRGGRGGERGG